jgi:DNA-binding response OmpR family regulator
MKILLVDDDLIFLAILETALHAEGYKDVSCVESGADALELIDLPSVRYDCILLDINMPKMDGIELSRRIRKLHDYAHVPILALTASATREQIDAALDAGVTDYLHKPIDPTELIARMRVAQQILQQAWEKSRAAHEASIYRDHAAKALAFSVPDAITIADVANVVAKAEFEVFLLRLGWLNMFQSCVVGLAISDFASIFSKSGPTETRELLTDVASAISASLGGMECVLTYTGSGEFLCAARRGNAALFENLESRIAEELAKLEISDSEGNPMNIGIVIGKPVLPSLLSALKPTLIETKALASLADRKLRAGKIRALGSGRKTLSTLLQN